MNDIKREGFLTGSKVLVEDKSFQDFLTSKGFGERKEQFSLSLNESLFLLEQKKIKIKDSKNKIVSFDSLLRQASKNKSFFDSFIVFKDLKSKGFVVKTGLKFGFSFRVYPKG